MTTAPSPASASALESKDAFLILRDGRKIAYTVFGDQSLRHTVFYFHGVPGGRHEARLGSNAAAEMGVSLIAVDRPGFGLSSIRRKRKILDTPEDIATLADHLGIKRFGVIGVSGGGPHAAACALQLKDRLTSISLVSSPAPLEMFRKDILLKLRSYIGFLGMRSNILGNLLTSMFVRRLGQSPNGFMSVLDDLVPPADRTLMELPEVAAILGENRNVIWQHTRGLAQELMILSYPWGFALRDIQIPIHVWHGTDDEIVPFSMGRYLAQQIPHVTRHFQEGIGHLLILHKLPEIVRTMRAELST